MALGSCCQGMGHLVKVCEFVLFLQFATVIIIPTFVSAVLISSEPD